MAMHDEEKVVRMSVETSALSHNFSNLKVPSNVTV